VGAWDDLGIEQNEGPTYWSPENPEKIRGKVLEIGRFTDNESKVHPQLVLDVDGEEVTVTAFRQILKQELNAVENLAVGDELEIDYQGKAPGKRYYVYRVTKMAEAPKRSAKGEVDEF